MTSLQERPQLPIEAARADCHLARLEKRAHYSLISEALGETFYAEDLHTLHHSTLLGLKTECLVILSALDQEKVRYADSTDIDWWHRLEGKRARHSIWLQLINDEMIFRDRKAGFDAAQLKLLAAQEKTERHRINVANRTEIGSLLRAELRRLVTEEIGSDRYAALYDQAQSFATSTFQTLTENS